MKFFKPNDFLLVRWLAIAGAAGAAVAAALNFFSEDSYWNTVTFVAALLTVAAVAALWRALASRNVALVDAVQESGDQQRILQALHQELEIHRSLERELVEAKQTAESAVMAKGEFLATMSHEIRTPLNGIIPMLDLLMTSRLPPDQHEFLRTAYTSSRQMLRIVDDILDYSKLEANKLQLESTSFNLRDLLDSIVRLMEKPAESKGLRLNLQIDPGVRLALRGDPVRLRQVLTNLISNALKFTERGSVGVVVSRKGETKSQHEIRFEVHDTGIGISQDNIKNLFRAFAQADASTTRLYGGTGLGLVICKRIVDLMGGTIGVDSEIGRGSTFWFEVPLLKAVGDMQGQRSDLSGARVLLLSSDTALRQRMQQAVPAWGAHLSNSQSTQDALAQLRNGLSRGANWTIDLLLVDLNSVRSTSIALHRNLQRSAEFETLPVVYLKGEEPPPAELSDGQQVLILSRAMGVAEMRTALSTFVATPPPPARSKGPGTEALAEELSIGDTPPPPSGIGLKGRVLLVEDNPINQKVAQSLIKIIGLQCETADNGQIALERMAVGDLDLVLMDCQMPVKDGYSATSEWRLHETANNLPPLPIIAMTANAMAGDRQKCLDAGMDDYLSKPVDRRVLEACLARWLQRSPQRALRPAVVPGFDAEAIRHAIGVRDAAAAAAQSVAGVAVPATTTTESAAGVAVPAAAAGEAAAAAATRVPARATGEYVAGMAVPAAAQAVPARAAGESVAGVAVSASAPTVPATAAATEFFAGGSNPAPAAASPSSPAPALPPRTGPVITRETAPAAPVAPAVPVASAAMSEPARAPSPMAAMFAAAASAPGTAAASPAGPLPPILEMEVVEELRSIMGAEYQGLVRLFLEDAPTHIHKLQVAAAAGDIKAMVAPSHTLKSSSANLGALALSAVAKRIEFGARTDSLPKPTLAVLMLENEFRRAKAALHALDH